MKKIGKLTINPEKVIKNEELINLKGGSYSGTCAGYSPTGGTLCNVSRTTAIFWAGCEDTVNGTDCNGGHWCCDSCNDNPPPYWYDC